MGSSGASDATRRRTVTIDGSGRVAAEWGARWLAAGSRVVVDDASVADAIAELWTEATLLGAFPGASLTHVIVGPAADAATEPGDGDLVMVVDRCASDDDRRAPLVVSTLDVVGHAPIHVVPLVDVAEARHAEAIVDALRGIGMAPRRSSDDPLERRRLGPGLVEFTGGDAAAIAAVIRSLRATGHPLGIVHGLHEAAKLAAGGVEPWRDGDTPDAPLRLYRTAVESEWVDYNGHMTEAAYLTAAGWASDALFRYIGDDEAYRAAGHSFYTVETHIHYRAEVDADEPIEFTTHVLGVDGKRVHLVHEMWHGVTSQRLCTVEQMLVHVDMDAGRSAPILPGVAAALEAIAAAHADLAVPDGVGSVMRLPARRS
jgi:carnitine 3-dehydrogenase